MDQIRVLFICSHNSARSQMAEALLKKLGGDRFYVRSAGITPGTLNPLAVAVLAEIGIDISANRVKSAADFLNRGETFDYVITVCDQAAGVCPFFPGTGRRLEWSFADPSAFTGSQDEKLSATRLVRDQIKDQINEWLKER